MISLFAWFARHRCWRYWRHALPRLRNGESIRCHRSRRGRSEPPRSRQAARRQPQARGDAGVHRREARRADRRADAGRRLFHPHFQQGRGPERACLCAGAGARAGRARRRRRTSLPGSRRSPPIRITRTSASWSSRSAKLKAPVPVDLVWTSQNYHDLHNFPGLDVGVFNQMVFDALKPGGIYLVLDHAAEPGSGARDTATLHRIDADTVKKEVLAAGFVFVGSSDLLRQPADSHRSRCSIPASAAGPTSSF